ncbi:MAG TPA: DUF1565 domain-containing protein [Polyangiaceae bacterium]|nr:DUF1565 domain-containing protein [Polyangiaceae bacterium]
MWLGRSALPCGVGLFPALLGCGAAPTSDQAVTHAPIVVDGHGTDRGNGTAAAPFRTLGRALAAAKPGDTVQLAAGDYTLAAGEEWGYSAPPRLTIRGDTSQTTHLYGPAYDGRPGFEVVGTLTLEHLELNGFGTALEQTAPGALSLSDVNVVNCTAGVVVRETSQGAVVRIDDSQISGGVFVDAPESELYIDATDVDGSTSSAAVNFSGRRVDISGSTLRPGATSFGVSLRAGALSLSDTSISGGNYGVYQLLGSSRLRHTQIEDYGSIGLYFASGALDLGTETEAGDNAFVDRGVGTAFGLYVDTGTEPATASNTSFDGVTPEASVVTATTEEVAAPGAYFITPGQRLTFFRVSEP